MAKPVKIEAEFGGKNSFVDITTAVTSIVVIRGRTDYTEQFSPGVAQVEALNYDGELDPDNTGGSYYGEILIGRRIRITSNADSLIYAQRIYEGAITDYTLNYDVSGTTTVSITCADGLAELAQRSIDDAAVSAELTGARVTSILGLSDVNYTGTTNISTGYSTCAAGTASGNALSYLHQVSITEQGALFVNRNGVLRFLDRYELLSGPVETFSDDGSDINYEQVERLLTQTELYNQLEANRASATPVIRNDTTSQTTYGIRLLDLGLVFFATDAEVTDMLDYAMVRYANTSPRIAKVTTLLDDKLDADVAQLCQLELTDSVTVEFTPPNSTAITLDCIIESIAHYYTVGAGWRATFGFSPRDTSNYLVLDDATLGRLDYNVLAF